MRVPLAAAIALACSVTGDAALPDNHQSVRAEQRARLREAVQRATPLHIAAFDGHTEAIKALLAAGASVDAQDDQKKWTPLDYARKAGHTETANVLLAAFPLRKWLGTRELDVEQHLPVLHALGVVRLADLSPLRGIEMRDLFSDIAWSLSMGWLPTSLPCAPRCSAVKAALYKAINASPEKDEL